MAAEDQDQSDKDIEALWPDQVRRERNLDIVSAKMRGLSYRTVATSFGISIGHVKRLVAQWRSVNPTLREKGSTEILDDILDWHTSAIEELALLATTAKQDSVKVGAIKAKLEAMRTVTEILQATGNLPNDLGQLRLQIDVQAVTARFLAVFDAHDVPDEVAEALLAALTGGGDEDDQTLPAIGRG